MFSPLKGTGKLATSWGRVDFIAPNLIIYKFTIQIKDKSDDAQTVLYSIPLGKNKCRILHSNVVGSLKWFIKIRQNN